MRIERITQRAAVGFFKFSDAPGNGTREGTFSTA
jgi:hypothetical protein